jgi:hypothetical protein
MPLPIFSTPMRGFSAQTRSPTMQTTRPFFALREQPAEGNKVGKT